MENFKMCHVKISIYVHTMCCVIITKFILNLAPNLQVRACQANFVLDVLGAEPQVTWRLPNI